MFSWKPFYTELASKLLENKNRRKELVEFVYSSLEFTNYLRMENGDKIKNIDPFSFFGIFNRRVGDEYRRTNLKHIKEYFQILSNVPDDFDGIPILDARNSFFYQWHDENTLLQSCDLLWKIFESGVNGTVTEEELSEFVKLDGVGISSATIGLFWINPDYYMPMDGNSKKYLGDLGLNCKKVDASSYLSVLAEIRHKMGTKEIQEQTLVEISRKAWQLGKAGRGDAVRINKDKGLEMNSSSLAREVATLLKKTHNIILHGAPGTGKTHLAKEIAKKLGCSESEIGFVQFHPSYDYTDFVEGLRPVNNGDGQVGFERKDGVFKAFCVKAVENYLDSKKSTEEIGKEKSISEQMESFLATAIDDEKEFQTVTGNKFYITDSNEKNIYVSVPENEKTKEVVIQMRELKALLNANNEIKKVGDIRLFFNRKWRTHQDSFIFIMYEKIKAMSISLNKATIEKIPLKPFVFIIDEINRGEMSKIFGELFFCIDPGYRGHDDGGNPKGLIKTQYNNLVEEGDIFYGGFFIPENVYIIGTMNDIDRSVESMDFAFRRRFTFVEVKASDTQETILSSLDDSIRTEAIARMNALNTAITKIEGLSSAYHIGGAYFLKLKELDNYFGKLWEYHLYGLLREYLRGMENAEDELKKLKEAYDKPTPINNENDGE